jgi:hypothetical protein
LAKQFLEEVTDDDPQWGTIKNKLQTPIPRMNIYELVVVWETQQKVCKELLSALRSDRIPNRLKNFVTHHNLQIMRVAELNNLELIISVKRNVSENRKTIETLRRTYLPNGRVNKRNSKRQGYLDKMETAIKALQNHGSLIFVPPHSRAAYQLIQHIHDEITAHGSFQIVETAVQQKWLVPKLTRIYKRVRKACINCRFIDCQPITLPEGNLLAERCVNQYPFEVSGVDFAGPFDVLRRKYTKSYICIFTCPYSRAVSLQAMRNKDYASFLQAFEKFKYTRGVRPILVRSDNEKTFLTAADQEKLKNQHFEVEWKFNPPQSPHFGGIYERLIKMVKQKYARCYNRQRFDDFAEFEVAISYLEYIINNRPLFTSKDPVTQQIVVIRPSHFIHPGHPDQFDHDMTNLFSARTEEAAKAGLLERKVAQMNRFKRRVKLLFDETYVNMLRKVHLNKIFSRQEDPRLFVQVGEAVLIKPVSIFKEKSFFTKLNWPIGHVQKVHFDHRTNRPKALDVTYYDEKSQSDRELKNFPITHFAPLELSVEAAERFVGKNPSRTQGGEQTINCAMLN